MITRCEVASALARKAARLVSAGDAEATMFAAMSRVFGRQAIEEVMGVAHLVTAGFAESGDVTAAGRGCELAQKIGARASDGALTGRWTDLALVGELLKQRD